MSMEADGMTMMLFEMGGEPGERGYFRACFLGLSVFFVLTFLIAVPGAASEMPGTQEQAFAVVRAEAERGDARGVSHARRLLR